MGAEAVVLGSGTSSGVPVLGRTYPESFLANPKNHRLRPSLLLRLGESTVLIDCTPDMRQQLLREQVLRLDAAIITHTHADHVMGMDDLRTYSLIAQEPMPVYAWPQYQQDIRRIFAYAFLPFPPGVEVPRFDLRDLPDRLEFGGFELEVLRVMHGSLPVAAFRIGDFAYVTDVGEIPPAAYDRLRGLKTLILDAVRYAPHPNHFHFDRAVEVALDLKAEVTCFTHLSHDYDHDVVEAGLPPAIRLAYDGLRIPL